MGMQHVQKNWNMADKSWKGTNQSNHSMPPTPTHTTGGDNSKPSIPKSNQAGPTTPKFYGKGMPPITGTGRGRMTPGK
jgi:hypothetical protein